MKFKLVSLLGTSTACLIAVGLSTARQAEAACSGLPATAGADTIVCDGTGPDSPGFATGAGNDSVTITGGVVTGTILQEGGRDSFVMSGGEIAALNQGGELDFAEISGGRIIGLFYAGDDVTMTGGQIGEVDLEQANNIFRMSGGIIDLNLSAAQHNDTLILSGGRIGGTVDFGNGNNSFTVTGGTIIGNVQSLAGTDTFTWDGGGAIGGSVTLGEGNDRANLSNLTDAIIDGTILDGQAGTDTLTFSGTTASWGAQFLNWENADLTDNSELTATQDIVLGDAGTLQGAMTIDGSSRLLAGNGVNAVFRPFDPTGTASLSNAGAIDLTNGGSGAGDIFTVRGQYAGTGGRVVLDTVLGSDGSASDRLILADAPATGTTGLEIRNFGGPGALTTADGILVVEEQGGASAGTAFHLAEPVAAGAFDYLLFQGNAAGDEVTNWYLRSQLIDEGPDPEPPIPLYRPEASIQSAVAPLARELTAVMLGTFHERRGEQAFFRDGQDGNRFWMRSFAQYLDMSWQGTVDPSFEGSAFGFQAGADFYREKSESGGVTAAGLFGGYGRITGDVEGFAQAIDDFEAGKAPINGYSIGANVVHVGPEGWYLDSVLMGTLFDGRPNSDRGVSADLDGTAITASLESGIPLALGDGIALEPQAQVIWQHLDLDDGEDDFADISYDTPDTFTGRLGARLTGSFESDGGTQWQPYLKANLWYSPSETDEVSFDADEVKTKIGSTAVELGGGLVTQISDNVRLFGTGDYTFDVGGEKKEAVEGNLGLQVSW